MNYDEKIVDRQVGRNADLFARTIGEMPTIEERYPYIRILISVIEQAHPEWNQAPTRDSRIALLVFHMSKGAINQEETAEIVRLRDEERGFTYIERKPEPEKKSVDSASEEAPPTANEEVPAADTAAGDGAAADDTDAAPAGKAEVAAEDAPAGDAEVAAEAATEETPAPDEAPAPAADEVADEATEEVPARAADDDSTPPLERS